MYLGNFAEDATVNLMFTTNAADGAPIAPNSAFEAADLVIYKDNSATQKTSANGVTMTSPFDSVTGLHQVSIDTSNDTGDSGFWQAGHDYTVVLEADETVDGVAVTSVLAQFSLDNRIAKLSNGTGTGQVSLSSGAVLLQPTQTGVTIPTVTTVTNPVSLPQTIYVDDGGNDGNSGLTSAAPKLTISAAVTAAGVGGKVIVMPGTYSGAVAVSINNVTIEGQNATGCTLTHNSGPTLDIQSRTGITLRNLTITNSAETSSGTGLYAQSSFNTLIEGCYINGKLDAAHFGSATAVRVIRSKFSGAYDGVNLTDTSGVFEQCTFLTDTTHSSTSVDKRACYITASSSAPKLHFADCDFQVLQIVSNNTGKLVGMTSAGSVTMTGTNRFVIRSLDGDYDGDLVAIIGGDGSSDGHVSVEGGVAFYMTTVGAGDAYHAQATIGNSSVRFASGAYDPAMVTGNVLNISPTAAMVNTTVEGGQVGTDASAAATLAATIDSKADDILEDTGTTLPTTLSGLSTFDASTDEVTLADGSIDADKFDGSTSAPLSATQAAYIDASIAGISLGANPNVLLTAEIATVTNQTTFTLAGGADFDDAYNGQTIVLYDDSNSDFPSVRVISDYVGSTKTVTIDSAPAFTLGTDDSVAIFATAPGTTAPTAETVATAVRSELTTELGRIDVATSTRLAPTTAGRTLDVTTGGAAGIDWGNVENPTTSVNLSGSTISTSQAVASVSGAVGSVTGNVGGNVTGSVGSISGISFPSNFASQSIDGSGRVLLQPTQTGVTIPTVTTLTGHTAQTGDAYARLGAPAGASIAADIAGIEAGSGLDAAGVRAAIGMASANLDTQLSGKPTLSQILNGTAAEGFFDNQPAASVDLTEQQIQDLVDGLVEAGAVASPVDADVIDDSRTWFATDNRARNIVTVNAGFDGTLALQPDLNPGTTIAAVTSVSITGAATVTATELQTNRGKTRAHFTVPTLSTTGTYTVSVTVTTVDDQTIVTTGTLRVQ